MQHISALVSSVLAARPVPGLRVMSYEILRDDTGEVVFTSRSPDSKTALAVVARIESMSAEHRGHLSIRPVCSGNDFQDTCFGDLS